MDNYGNAWTSWIPKYNTIGVNLKLYSFKFTV